MDLSLGLYQPEVSPFRIMRVEGTSLPHLFEMDPNGVGCLSGELELCRCMVLERVRSSAGLWNGNVLYQAYPALSSEGDWWFLRPLGRRESTFLAAMVRSLGRERFARFWTSDEPVPKAFEQAAGEPLDLWTSRWLAKRHGPVPPRGAGVAPSGWQLSVVLIISALLIAARVSRNRQFA